MMQKRAISWLLGLTLLISGLALPACTTNPATGAKTFNLLSQQEEVQLGNQAEPEFIAEYGGEVPLPAVRQYVSNLGQRLAAVSERKDLPWEFHIVNSGEINAFALPGGKVFITRGLVEKLDNEAQLAAILGHEIGHVTAQHIGQQMSQAMVLQTVAEGLGRTAGSAATNTQWLQVLGLGVQVGGPLYLLKFGRDQENQADSLGMRYMTRLGYNPSATLQVMQVLKSEGAGGQIEFLSTHPAPDSRITNLRAILKQRYPQALQATNPYHTDADRFRQQALAPLSQLPPPPKAAPQQAPKQLQAGNQPRQRISYPVR